MTIFHGIWATLSVLAACALAYYGMTFLGGNTIHIPAGIVTVISAVFLAGYAAIHVDRVFNG